jgi:predicted chitinase
MITVNKLLKCMPNLSKSKADAYFPYLKKAMEQFEINTVLREAAFLAQLGHESASLRYMEEIASGSAYEGRADLGNTEKGDGRRYKGRGPIQLTGRSNYRKYGQILGVDLENHPEKAATPEYGFKIAGLYWKLHELNALADSEDVRGITRRINGGYNGLADRLYRYELAKVALESKDV